jgi:hypothetical protein
MNNPGSRLRGVGKGLELRLLLDSDSTARGDSAPHPVP